MIVVAVRPHIVFKYVLEKRSIEYYVRFVMRTLLALALCLVLWEIKKLILVEVTLLRFLVMCVLTFLIPNIAFLTVFGRSESFKDILARLKRR